MPFGAGRSRGGIAGRARGDTVGAMQVTVLGGGGFRVPLVFGALTEAMQSTPATVVLYDVDPHRLQVIAAVCRQLGAGRDAAPSVRTTTDLDEALRGADVVFSAIRVGGVEGRVRDERVAIDAGLLGQETVGPGGLAYAIRTLPVAEEIAARISVIAPQAWTINFTNPAGMITEAMRTHLGDRVFGICDTPIGLVRRVARLLDVPAHEADADYQGVNHLGWLTGFWHHGQNLLPDLLADDARLAALEEARILGAQYLRTQGAIPNEYLYYYTHRPPAPPRQTRGEFLAAQQRAFYAAGPGPDALERWRAVLRERESTYMAEAREGQRREEDMDDGGYHRVAVDLMTALRTGRPARMILGVANGGTLPWLSPESVVEVMCAVDDDGARPLPLRTGPGADQTALMQAVKAAEGMLVAAVRERSRSAVVEAFAAHPLVGGDRAAGLLAAYARAEPEVGRVLTGT